MGLQRVGYGSATEQQQGRNREPGNQGRESRLLHYPRTGYTTTDCPPRSYQEAQLPTRMQEASQSPVTCRVPGPCPMHRGQSGSREELAHASPRQCLGAQGCQSLGVLTSLSIQKEHPLGHLLNAYPRGPGPKHQVHVPSESQEEARLGLSEGRELGPSTESRKSQPPARCRLAPSHLEASSRWPSPHTQPLHQTTCPESRAKPLDKEDVVHIYNGISLSYIKAQNNAICNNKDGTRESHTE